MILNWSEAAFRLRQRRAETERRKMIQRVSLYIVVMLEDMSVGDLVHRLKGTGLTVSTMHGQNVIRVDPNVPGDAA